MLYYCVYYSKHHLLSLLHQAPFPTELAFLSMLFILQVVCRIQASAVIEWTGELYHPINYIRTAIPTCDNLRLRGLVTQIFVFDGSLMSLSRPLTLRWFADRVTQRFLGVGSQFTGSSSQVLRLFAPAVSSKCTLFCWNTFKQNIGVNSTRVEQGSYSTTLGIVGLTYCNWYWQYSSEHAIFLDSNVPGGMATITWKITLSYLEIKWT